MGQQYQDHQRQKPPAPPALQPHRITQPIAANNQGQGNAQHEVIEAQIQKLIKDEGKYQDRHRGGARIQHAQKVAEATGQQDRVQADKHAVGGQGRKECIQRDEQIIDKGVGRQPMSHREVMPVGIAAGHQVFQDIGVVKVHRRVFAGKDAQAQQEPDIGDRQEPEHDLGHTTPAIVSGHSLISPFRANQRRPNHPGNSQSDTKMGF